ncbi:MAG: thiol:disulfide interchange protein DsbA/DsbL [Gammaproteobacteria bacterium]
MKTHRQFMHLTGQSLGALLTLSLAFCPAGAVAQEKTFVEGGHYELLREAQPVQTGDKIEVVEMFWYQCPHCYRLEPFITQWLQNKPDNAAFVPIPAVLGPRWAFSARMFYALEALGLGKSLHAEVFNAIHAARRPLENFEQFADWAVENGAKRSEIRAAFDSFAVNNKINFAEVMTRRYGLTGVPAIIVDGRYRTSVTLAGSHQELLEVINYLVALAAKARAG